MNKESKISIFKRLYLDEKGCSELIDRYKLPEGLSYTSGDGIFRNDSTLGKNYKFFRFSPTLDIDKKTSCSWKLTEQDKIMIQSIHKQIDFKDKKGNIVYYIQFFGKCQEVIDEGIRSDIRIQICKEPCVNCGTTTNIECDHKNDLKNNKRVLIKETQILDDFQPLCKHCNDVKRAIKTKMLKLNKRIGAKYLYYKIDFTKGDETLNMDDPYWYIGTYWGDCKAFKESI